MTNEFEKEAYTGVFNIVKEDFHQELRELLHSSQITQEQKDVLEKEAQKAHPDYEALFDTALTWFKQQNSFERLKLSHFFLVLSELKGLPRSVYDFAMDAMLCCESEEETGNFILNKQELIDRYKQEIKPLLRSGEGER